MCSNGREEEGGTAQKSHCGFDICLISWMDSRSSLSVCQSLPLRCLSVCLSVSLCFCLCVSVCLSLPVSTSPLSVCLSVSLCFYLCVSVCLSLPVSTSPLSVCLSVSLCFHNSQSDRLRRLLRSYLPSVTKMTTDLTASFQ